MPPRIAALATVAALLPAQPDHAVPPPPTLLCANDFSTTNLTCWSKSGGRWAVADGVYEQTRTTSNATSWYQAEFSAHSASARIKLESPSRASSFVSFNIATRDATTAYRLVYASVDGVMLFGGYVAAPAGAHNLGGVGLTASSAAGAFDDLRVIFYGPNSTPKCPTTPV